MNSGKFIPGSDDSRRLQPEHVVEKLDLPNHIPFRLLHQEVLPRLPTVLVGVQKIAQEEDLISATPVAQ
jgi:hypothetical protein